jgi:hypothetical protein
MGVIPVPAPAARPSSSHSLPSMKPLTILSAFMGPVLYMLALKRSSVVVKKFAFAFAFADDAAVCGSGIRFAMRGEGRYARRSFARAPGEYDECDVEPPPEADCVREFEVAGLGLSSGEISISVPSPRPKVLLGTGMALCEVRKAAFCVSRLASVGQKGGIVVRVRGPGCGISTLPKVLIGALGLWFSRISKMGLQPTGSVLLGITPV